jgi:hypothetical protein
VNEKSSVRRDLRNLMFKAFSEIRTYRDPRLVSVKRTYVEDLKFESRSFATKLLRYYNLPRYFPPKIWTLVGPSVSAVPILSLSPSENHGVFKIL